ncbi:MAG: hypothetical protein ACOC5F_01345 [Candidatus Aminicenantaceae bacterium]
MRNKIILLIIILFLLLIPSEKIYSQDIEFTGQLSGGLAANFEKPLQLRLNLRYIPELYIEKNISKKYFLDAEVSLNTYAIFDSQSLNTMETDGNIKPYRMWLRFSSNQFEARVGLQKINFGPALLLRSLMWFDKMDPRDPLQITDGVYGLLMRYYFLNNSNIWIWGLYGNNKTKGWEVFPSQEKKAEFGGRFQFPVPSGEMALTCHHRRADLNRGSFDMMLPENSIAPENRLALDAKFDIGIGLWFEGAVIHQNNDSLPYQYKKTLNIGMDYTFALGNGLNIVGEHLVFNNSHEFFGPGDLTHFSAFSFNYPLSLLDTLSSIFYYDWENNSLYSFVNWKRTYDKWSFHLIGFWNPDRFQIYQVQNGTNLFTGHGFLFMVVFNH